MNSSTFFPLMPRETFWFKTDFSNYFKRRKIYCVNYSSWKFHGVFFYVLTITWNKKIIYSLVKWKFFVFLLNMGKKGNQMPK